MMTDYKRKLIYTGMSQSEGLVFHEIEQRIAPFDKDIIGGPWHKILREVNSRPGNEGVRVVQPALFHALKEAGWIDKGLVYAKEYPNKQHCFVRPELKDWSNSEIRREWARLNGEGAPKDNVIPINRSV